MDNLLSLLIIGALVVLIFLVLRKDSGPQGDTSIFLQEMNAMRQTLDSRLGQSGDYIAKVKEQLVRVDETNKQVIGFADELRKLQNTLTNPKHRGVFGEYYLETLLKNAFQPNDYKMQYKFKDGESVDAALFVGDKVVPIDSKFSLENYNRLAEESDPIIRAELESQFVNDLKKRIEETSKYIRPSENTTDFAFMFIPAEGIYYDLLVNKIGSVKANTRDVIDYAINEKHVHIVSPTTFYVTLQSMFQGMRAFQVQESTKEILKNVVLLGNHLKAYDEYMKKLGKNLGTTVNSYNESYKELNKIDKDIVRMSGGEKFIEPVVIDKPQD